MVLQVTRKNAYRTQIPPAKTCFHGRYLTVISSVVLYRGIDKRLSPIYIWYLIPFSVTFKWTINKVTCLWSHIPPVKTLSRGYMTITWSTVMPAESAIQIFSWCYSGVPAVTAHEKEFSHSFSNELRYLSWKLCFLGGYSMVTVNLSKIGLVALSKSLWY